MAAIKYEFVALDLRTNQAKSFETAKQLSIFFLGRRFKNYVVFHKITFSDTEFTVNYIDLSNCSGDVCEIEKCAASVEDYAIIKELES